MSVSVYVNNLLSSFPLNTDGNDYLMGATTTHEVDSRTNLILKGGDDVMKRGRASLLHPLHSHHRWKEREGGREREME